MQNEEWGDIPLSQGLDLFYSKAHLKLRSSENTERQNLSEMFEGSQGLNAKDCEGVGIGEEAG